MNKVLYKYQDFLFNSFVIISYIILFASIIGLSDTVPKYVYDLDYYVRIYICLFLIWRFNPLRSSYEFTDLDRKITFNSGLFILTTTYLNQYLTQIKGFVKF
jgi:hypothetical protein